MAGKNTFIATEEQTAGKIKLPPFFNTALLWLDTLV